MIIKTATLIAAGLVLAGSCLTAALVVGAEPAPTPVAVSVPPTSVPAAPAVVKPAWASEHGKDQYGTWADLNVADVTQRFRWIRPGTFTMGSSQEEKDAALALDPGGKPEWLASEVPHQVTLTQGFWLADSACTQALWQAITGSNPASFKDSPQNPVEQVSWDDCQQFLSKLNGRVSGGGFRLPSEAQWEYACRAGTTTTFSFGSTITPEQVNYNGNYPFAGAAKGLSRQKTVPVKSLPPNAWGLYEMHGNVWQWCNDWYGDFSGSAERDPAGPSSGSARVSRGGSWGSGAGYCRSALRIGGASGDRDSSLGFRIVAQATP
jgi:formylglycine-generating enzyme required for sulfatase activity